MMRTFAHFAQGGIRTESSYDSIKGDAWIVSTPLLGRKQVPGLEQSALTLKLK